VMKTVEERVQEYLSKYVQTFNRQQERELIKLLKEQDRITREACAEVAGTWCLVPPDGGSPTDSETRFCDGLEQAIMNTKAV